MSSFTAPLVVEPLDDGRKWKLVGAFEYHVGSLSSDEVIKVPAGFVTDFASVPRVFWHIVPPWGRYGKAAIIHDFCYKAELYPRKRCDRIFYEGMELLKVARWKSSAMYCAVRWFGWIVWNKHTPESVAEHKQRFINTGPKDTRPN